VGRWKGRLVVIGTLLVVLGVVTLMLFRSRTLSVGYVELRTFTDDASGLMDGTQVRLNGIPIGYLEAQKLTRSLDLMRKVELDLRVRTSYLREIPSDSVAGLSSDNLLGDQYIAIHRGQSSAPIAAGGELRAMQAQDIGKMMARFSQQLDRLQNIAQRADKLLSGATAGHGSVGKIAQDTSLAQASGMSNQIDAIMNDMQHGKGTIAKLFYEDPISAQLESPMKRVDAIMATVGDRATQMKELTGELDRSTKQFQALQAELKAGKGSLGNMDQFSRQLDGLTANFNGMMDRINSGQGTIGQLMVNPQLNEALEGTMREVQELAKGLSRNPRKFIAIRVF
jgi:phospholipid/cholesterol/gamma-HCH transport system substrate-binding protein